MINMYIFHLYILYQVYVSLPLHSLEGIFNMLDPYHAPNRLELFLVFIVIGIALLSTGIVFPMLISTDKLPLYAIIGLFLLLFFLLVVIIQFIFNFFYVLWQKKDTKKYYMYSFNIKTKKKGNKK